MVSFFYTCVMADRFRIERKFKRDREETCGKEKHNSQIAERRDKEADEITEDTHTHTRLLLVIGGITGRRCSMADRQIDFSP